MIPSFIFSSLCPCVAGDKQVLCIQHGPKPVMNGEDNTWGQTGLSQEGNSFSFHQWSHWFQPLPTPQMPYHISAESLHLVSTILSYSMYTIPFYFANIPTKGSDSVRRIKYKLYHQSKYIIKSVLGFQYIKLLLSLITAPSNIHLLENTWCYWEGSRDFHADIAFPKDEELRFLSVLHEMVASASQANPFSC